MTYRQNSEKSHPLIQVHITRGNFTESVHLVDAIVVDEKGETVAVFGDGERVVTYPRSAIKMLQALSFVESGAFHNWDLDERHLTLACASHNGEEIHTELVMNWLERIGCHEDQLVCGPHLPYNEVTARELVRHNQRASRRHNNCSGKHTSMLSTLVKLKIDPRGYGSYDHELQKRLRQIVSETCGEDMNAAAWGGDGCGIPTYAMSLKAIAKGLRRFLPEQKDLSQDRQSACRLIRQAVLSQPYFIGGVGDTCTDLMTMVKNKFLLKSGAEGVYAGALLEQGLSFALKVRDGNARASRVAMTAILHQFKVLTDGELLQLSSHTQPVIRDCNGQAVGKIFVPHPLMG